MKHKWQANWIESTVTKEEEAPVFKKEFEVCEKAEAAEIYICGLGFYYFKINGKRISKDMLQPAFSNDDKTVYYNVYDITESLTVGKNTIEVPNELIPFWTKHGDNLYYKDGKFNRDG